MIRIENLSKTYEDQNGKKFYAIKDINLQIKRNEIFGIIGLSGAGKSTLIRCLNRLEEPTSGKIVIDNKEITNQSKSELRKTRQEIGMIFQHFNLLSSKNVYKNIAFPLELEGMKKEEIEEKVNTLLKYVELEDKRDSYPSQLSGGQKQRVAIARALANRPSVIFADEPTGNLDSKATNEVMNMLEWCVREYRQTLVMITHNNDIAKTADKLITIKDGKIEGGFKNESS